jgi:23S rRNA U2552 (ribose-2'-O)-methylase RlmE/FtsJ
MYKQFTIQFKKYKKDLGNENPEYAKSIDYPKISYGFQQFLDANKNKMEILKQFEGKKKVYRVMNQFEETIDEYDETIQNEMTKYLKIEKDKPQILSRGFYKMWEILKTFDLINDNKKIITAHLAEGPGSFIQATMEFRSHFLKTSKNDEYYGITLHSEKKNVPAIEQKFFDYYKQFTLHQTYPEKIAKGDETKDNGDLTSLKTINHFVKEVGSADLITADGGFEWENENLQEQEAFKLILGEFLTAIKLQKNGGCFVCKIFETFCGTTCKLIYLMNILYDEIHFFKPLTSRSSNSEKYMICIGFDGKNKEKYIKALEHILEGIKEDNYIINIFPDFILPEDFENEIINYNIKIANNQIVEINKIVDFINEQNYYGDTYEKNKEKQIESTKFWIKKFIK